MLVVPPALFLQHGMPHSCLDKHKVTPLYILQSCFALAFGNFTWLKYRLNIFSYFSIIFRYKVTDNTNISRATPKKFLSHVKTKNEPIMYLAEKAITNFENVNGGYVVSYTTKCISNLEILLMK